MFQSNRQLNLFSVRPLLVAGLGSEILLSGNLGFQTVFGRFSLMDRVFPTTLSEKDRCIKGPAQKIEMSTAP